MAVGADVLDSISQAVSRSRLVDTAMRLCSVYSPTGSAGEVSDALAELLASEGFTVERYDAGWPAAPAVAARLNTGKPGRTLQFNGHLDTVHLPFVKPAVSGDRMTGSGSADMKAGTAAAVEALFALRDSGVLPGGGILLTAHDLHEAPWGDGSQLDRLIDDGVRGDAALIPEYLCDTLAIAGRGQATFRATIRRAGLPVHEVMRDADDPNVIAVGAELVRRLVAWNEQLSSDRDPVAGAQSAFVGQLHAGEIYNQSPNECWLEGTRRWLPRMKAMEVEAEFRRLIDNLAASSRTTIELRYQVVRDAFRLPLEDPLVAAFDAAFVATGQQPLPRGAKRFVDDGSSFWARAGMAAITHGPQGGGAHTLEEWISIPELVRVAKLYAAIAVEYCTPNA
jgi:acetylornithine deacetylase/succinyl-diaminopimelate desuccinylase-like protein